MEASRYNVATTRPELMESLWVLSRRFMARNVLTPLEFTQLFRRQLPIKLPRHRGSTVYDRLDLAALAPWIGHTPYTVAAVLPGTFEFSRPLHRLGPVKLCPECAELGFHSVFHEVQWLDRCPIHRRTLSERCLECGRRLSHVTRFRFGETSNTLPCGHRWTTRDIRRVPEMDAAACNRLATWLQRLHARGTGEQWLGLALGRSHSLVAGDEDFRELRDLFSAMAGFPGLVTYPAFRSLGVKKWTLSNLPSDWFDRFLAETRRYADALYRAEWRSVNLAFQLRDGISLLRSFGKRRLVSAVRHLLQVVDLSSRTFIRADLNDGDAELVAAAFLRKHLCLNTQGEASDMDIWRYLGRAIRFSAQPLGLLCRGHKSPSLYWSPLARGP